MDTEDPSTVWLLWTLLLETSGCRWSGISLHLYLWGKSSAMQLLGHRAVLFLTLRGTSTRFSSFTSSHSHQQCKRVPLSPHPLQYLLFPILLIFPILTGVTWYLIVVLICISLRASDAEHFLKCLLAMCICSSEISFHVFCLFHDWIVCFFGVEFNKFFIDLGN